MNPDLLLEAIILSLKLAIAIHDDQPQELRTKFWTDQAKLVDGIQGMIAHMLAGIHGPA